MRRPQLAVGLPQVGREARAGAKHIANAMRILLQQKTTGLYFKELDAWVANPTEATDFLSSTKALAFCAANKIANVQLVLKFDEEHYDIVLPTTLGRAARPASLA